jgi:hypothetical protein
MRTRARLRRVAALPVLVALVGVGGCFGGSGGGATEPVMGASEVPVEDIIDWFHDTTLSPYRATVPVEAMAWYFVDEGGDESVRGDIAFVQAIYETGWFSFPGGGAVAASYNNFGGLGAGNGTTARFPDALTGVRAHIQHLRAYADPTVTDGSLAHPLVDPRFHYVSPKGRAPNWEDMGEGNWAMAAGYGDRVLSIYNELRRHAGLSPV